LFVGFIPCWDDVRDAFPQPDAILFASVGFLLDAVETLVEPPEGEAEDGDHGSLLRQLLEDALLHAVLRFALPAYNLDATDDCRGTCDDGVGQFWMKLQPECRKDDD
jgi:hypothetical protein